MEKKAVIFDVGGVLITSPVHAIREYEKELNLPKNTLTAAFITRTPNNSFSRLERGEIRLSEFCTDFKQECGVAAANIGVVLPSIFSVRELFYRMSKGQPIYEMVETLKKIKKSGIKTCILTNNWIDDINPTPTNHGFHNYVDVILESCKIGIRKPDTLIYQIACDKLAVHPTEVVYLDDLGVNLKPARKLGITTILVKDSHKAIQELQDIVNINLLDSKL